MCKERQSCNMCERMWIGRKVLGDIVVIAHFLSLLIYFDCLYMHCKFIIAVVVVVVEHGPTLSQRTPETQVLRCDISFLLCQSGCGRWLWTRGKDLQVSLDCDVLGAAMQIRNIFLIS